MDLKESLNNNRNMAIIIVLFLAAIGIVGWYSPRGLNFVFISLIMAAFLVILGLARQGLKRGVLINDVNLISLARFQIVIWTVIILSAFIAISIERVHTYWDICRYFPSVVIDPTLASNTTYACNCTIIKTGLFVKRVANPLAITVDWSLWALMGISTASLVGSSLISSGKAEKDPDPSQVQKTAQKFGQDVKDVKDNSRGTRYGNPDPKHSRLMDMFEGDEIGNTAYIDMAKVQMFSFTVIAALAYYLMSLELTLGTPPADIDKLPLIPQGLLWILGISHAGYLGSKGVDHTPLDGGTDINQEPKDVEGKKNQT